MRILRTIALVIVLSALTAAARAAPEELAGRWNVLFDMPDGGYETPVEFVVASNGRVAATILGPLGQFRITDTTGRFADGKVSLDASTSFGKLKMTAIVGGGRIDGKWYPAGIGSLFFKGALRGLRDGAHAPRPTLAVFDAAWAPIERDFYAIDYNGVDIHALRDRYRSQAAAARSEGELVTVMRRLVAEFKTSHLDFFATPRWTRELHTAPTPMTDFATTRGITWRRIAPSVGYIRIDSFEDGDDVVARIDRAFAELARDRAIVIDLRGNGGGTLAAAMRLGDHILPDLRPVGYFASRAGLVRRQAASIDAIDRATLPRFSGYDSAGFAATMARDGAVMLMTGGRAPKLYAGRLVILIDQYCFSASEALAGVIKEARAATLIGRRTPGLMLGANAVAIDGGWTLMVPVWDFRTPGGVRIEGIGVAPDIAVKERGRDADIPAALKFLGKR